MKEGSEHPFSEQNPGSTVEQFTVPVENETVADGIKEMVKHVPTVEPTTPDARMVVLAVQIELARQILDEKEHEVFAELMNELIQRIRKKRYPTGATIHNSWGRQLEGNAKYRLDVSPNDELRTKLGTYKDIGAFHGKLRSLGLNVYMEEHPEETDSDKRYRYFLEVEVQDWASVI